MDTQRYVLVQRNMCDRDAGGFVEEAQEMVAGSINFPPGYRLCGSSEDVLRSIARRVRTRQKDSPLTSRARLLETLDFGRVDPPRLPPTTRRVYTSRMKRISFETH